MSGRPPLSPNRTRWAEGHWAKLHPVKIQAACASTEAQAPTLLDPRRCKTQLVEGAGTCGTCSGPGRSGPASGMFQSPPGRHHLVAREDAGLQRVGDNLVARMSTTRHLPIPEPPWMGRRPLARARSRSLPRVGPRAPHPGREICESAKPGSWRPRTDMASPPRPFRHLLKRRHHPGRLARSAGASTKYDSGVPAPDPGGPYPLVDSNHRPSP